MTLGLRRWLTLSLLWVTGTLAQVVPTLPTAPTSVNLPISGNGPYTLNINTAGYTTKSVCTASCDYTNTQLQTALNAMICSSTGYIINLDYHFSQTGSFSFPSVTCAAGKYLILQSDHLGSLPPDGQRVNLTYLGSLPNLISNNVGLPALSVPNGSNNIIVRGIELSLQTGLGNHTHALVDLGDGVYTTVGQAPTNIILDQVISHGTTTDELRHGFSAQFANGAIINSYSDGNNSLLGDSDSQAIWTYCGPGPMLFDNNYLSATSEVFFVGGSDCHITNVVPSDITFSKNYAFSSPTWRTVFNSGGTFAETSATRTSNITAIVFNPATGAGAGGSVRPLDSVIVTTCTNATFNGTFTVLASPVPTASTFSYTNSGSNGTTTGCQFLFTDPTYAGTLWNVKDSLEFKQGKRILIKGNTIANMWNSLQSGRIISIKSEDQSGTEPWNETSDIDVSSNVWINAYGGWVQVSCTAVGNDIGFTGKAYFHNNLLYNMGGDAGFYIQLSTGSYPSPPTTTSCSMNNLYFNHNTIVNNGLTTNPNSVPSSMVYLADAVSAGHTPLLNFAFHNNIIGYDSTGPGGVINNCNTNGSTVPCTASNAWYNNIVYDSTGNCDANTFSPHAVQCPVAAIGNVGFTNVGANDYSLTPSSIGHNAATDGTDVGVDWASLKSNTSGSVSGVWLNQNTSPVPALFVRLAQ